ncbi:hypothetical protein Pint_19121 [Pistacia integerrima]|uniref:Uncharacterized protein n=1 Tax=Pistacia integerrima TaxID=434235 RepID=A0ACC0YZK3_9ROSI|nr:hypothetical protein Pint_19121 [Pistacia integerrima]
MVTSGLQSTNFQFPLVTANAQCGRTSYARKLFEEMPKRNLFFYNTLIKMYSRNGSSYDALNLFVEMLRLEVCRPDNYTYPFVIKACSDVGLRKLGVVFHGRTLVDGIDMDGIVQNCLIAMYMSFGEVEAARKVFDAMRDRSVVTWNTIISGYFRNGYARQALTVFDWMVKSGQEPDCASVVSVLPVCGYLKEVDVGRRVHALMENGDLGKKITAWNALVDMYVSFRVFARTSKKKTVPWNAILSGCVHNGLTREAVELFKQMQMAAVQPNDATLNSLLRAYAILADLQQAMNIHGYLIRSGFLSNVEIATGLIDIYSKCGSLESAHKIFSGISTKDKDIILWSDGNASISLKLRLCYCCCLNYIGIADGQGYWFVIALLQHKEPFPSIPRGNVWMMGVFQVKEWSFLLRIGLDDSISGHVIQDNKQAIQVLEGKQTDENNGHAM